MRALRMLRGCSILALRPPPLAWDARCLPEGSQGFFLYDPFVEPPPDEQAAALVFVGVGRHHDAAVGHRLNLRRRIRRRQRHRLLLVRSLLRRCGVVPWDGRYFQGVAG